MLFPQVGSPKFQLHPVILPEEIFVESLKQVGLPTQTVAELKFENGRGFTTTIVRKVSLHPLALVAMSVTGYVPDALYVWEGFCRVVSVLSPKLQFHRTGFPVERSVKSVGLLKHAVVALN